MPAAALTVPPNAPVHPDDRQERQRRWAAQFRLHIGVDAAKYFHAVVARDTQGNVLERARVHVTRDDFERIVQELLATFPGVTPAEMFVGIEFAGHHGATFAHFLKDRGFRVVAVLAMSTKKSREAALNSRLKSDLRDGRQICTLVREGVYARYPFPRPDVAVCKELAMRRHRLTVERSRMINRVRGLLDRFWPEFAGHFSGLDHKAPRAILRQWPSPVQLCAAPVRTVRRVIREVARGQHDRQWIDAFLADAAHTVGIREVLAEREGELLQTITRWDLLDAQIVETETALTAAVAVCPEATLLRTVPWVSAMCAATIIGEVVDPHAFRHPRQLLKLAGLNGVSQDSGLTQGRMRISKRGRPMLRRQLFLLAGRWCQKNGLYRADAEAHKATGRTGTETVVILARKLVPVLFAVLQSGQPFSEATFRAHRRPRETATA